MRTCISCGAVRDKEDLIRLVLNAQGLLVRDDRGIEQGRGAYVCSGRPCWDRLWTGNRLKRAFGRGGPVDFNPGG